MQFAPGHLILLRTAHAGWSLYSTHNHSFSQVYTRWSEAVLAGVGLISTDVRQYMQNLGSNNPALGDRALHAGALFLRGRFQDLKDHLTILVGSEYDDGTWYAVQFKGDDGAFSCSCPDYQRSLGAAGITIPRWHGQVVCKHIIAVWLHDLYRGENREEPHAMAHTGT